jgi:DNA-binding MarR family transcriptional regulator
VTEEVRRLGRVELVILEELSRRAVLTQRDALLHAAFPSLGTAPSATASTEDWRKNRSRAESAVSRAIRSLETKGMLVRERDPRTGRTSVRLPGDTREPVWEQLARAEEDLAVHCRQRARELQALASRASRRAQQLRVDHSTDATDPERSRDLRRLAELEQPPR